MKTLPLIAASSFLISCSSSKLEQDEELVDAPAPTSIKVETIASPPEPPKPSPPLQNDLFIDPDTSGLMTEDHKKTIVVSPLTPADLPEQPEESGVKAIPPLPEPPPID